MCFAEKGEGAGEDVDHHSLFCPKKLVGNLKGFIRNQYHQHETIQILKGSALFLLVLWTIFANSLVFIVLYKNPRLQTVPNLLVCVV